MVCQQQVITMLRSDCWTAAPLATAPALAEPTEPIASISSPPFATASALTLPAKPHPAIPQGDNDCDARVGC